MSISITYSLVLTTILNASGVTVTNPVAISPDQEEINSQRVLEGLLDRDSFDRLNTLIGKIDLSTVERQDLLIIVGEGKNTIVGALEPRF